MNGSTTSSDWTFRTLARDLPGEVFSLFAPLGRALAWLCRPRLTVAALLAANAVVLCCRGQYGWSIACSGIATAALIAMTRAPGEE